MSLDLTTLIVVSLIFIIIFFYFIFFQNNDPKVRYRPQNLPKPDVRNDIKRLLQLKREEGWLPNEEFRKLVALRKTDLTPLYTKELTAITDLMSLADWGVLHFVDLRMYLPDAAYNLYIQKQVDLVETDTTEYSNHKLKQLYRKFDTKYIAQELYDFLVTKIEEENTPRLLEKLKNAKKLDTWLDRMQKQEMFISDDVYQAYKNALTKKKLIQQNQQNVPNLEELIKQRNNLRTYISRNKENPEKIKEYKKQLIKTEATINNSI